MHQYPFSSRADDRGYGHYALPGTCAVCDEMAYMLLAQDQVDVCEFRGCGKDDTMASIKTAVSRYEIRCHTAARDVSSLYAGIVLLLLSRTTPMLFSQSK